MRYVFRIILLFEIQLGNFIFCRPKANRERKNAAFNRYLKNFQYSENTVSDNVAYKVVSFYQYFCYQFFTALLPNVIFIGWGTYGSTLNYKLLKQLADNCQLRTYCSLHINIRQCPNSLDVNGSWVVLLGYIINIHKTGRIQKVKITESIVYIQLTDVTITVLKVNLPVNDIRYTKRVGLSLRKQIKVFP